MTAHAAPATHDENKIRTLEQTTPFDGLAQPAAFHHGKVRDVYQSGEELLIVTSDRVSAFDVVLGTVPLKGPLLTEQAVFWLNRAAEICPTHLLERIGHRMMRVKRAQPLLVEVVVRGYLTGSLLREDPATRGQAYGLQLDPAHPPYGAFEAPIITPTTKAPVGDHDLPISETDITGSDRISAAHWSTVKHAALALFAAGQAHAADCDLILVDTKYEFGLVNGEVVLIDEIHTADSSRYWERSDYASRLAAGEVPRMLDKERLRQALLTQGYSGDGKPPALSAAVTTDLALHYWHLTERLTQRPVEFSPEPTSFIAETVDSFLTGAA